METINFDENSNSAPSAPISNNGDSGENNSNKKKKKLIMAGAVLVVLILSVIGWQYLQYTQSPYFKQIQTVKKPFWRSNERYRKSRQSKQIC